MQPGDLIATGTLSGASQSELGCLLEASWDGTRPCEMKSLGTERTANEGISRTWLEDGDAVHFKAQAPGSDGVGRVGFGRCSGKILGLQ